MYQFIIGIIMGILLTAFFYLAISIDQSAVNLPIAIVVILLILVAVTIYLAYRFQLQDKQKNNKTTP